MLSASRAHGEGKAYYSSAIAFSTCSSWPSTLTAFQSLATLPWASIRYVLRWMPIFFLPYMFFSRHAPYFSAILWPGSASRGKLSSYLSRNFSWLATSSGLMPEDQGPQLCECCLLVAKGARFAGAAGGVVFWDKNTARPGFPLARRGEPWCRRRRSV